MKVTVTALALALAFAGASTAKAGPITIANQPGTTYTTAGIDDYSANASRMEGMKVTAYWTVNGSSFDAIGFWDGGVNFSGNSFELTVNGNTLNADWRLDFDISGGLLQRLVFNGVPGNTVFDRTYGDNAGTAGSGLGKDLSGFDGYSGNIKATYFNPVALVGNAPVDDVFAGLDIEFLGGGGLGQNNNWRFSVDTDTTATRLGEQVDGSSTTLEAVPEPASMVLLGTGLLGIAAVARRRARRS